MAGHAAQERLDAFKALVLRWNRTINLVSRNSIDDIDTRHIADSLQLAHLVDDRASRWCDMGSGAGFPGIIVAIHFAALGRPMEMHLIESDSRKATFLRESARQLDLQVKVHNKRIEDTLPVLADIVSARALAPLAALCALAHLHLQPDGVCLFPKGARFQEEIDIARRDWSFDIDAVSSQTDPNAAILILRNLAHVRH